MSKFQPWVKFAAGALLLVTTGALAAFGVFEDVDATWRGAMQAAVGLVGLNAIAGAIKEKKSSK